jgi:hypothetical protein
LYISAFPANSMSKTSNLDITYDKYSSSYSSNHQNEIDNDFDIQNVSFMDQLLFKSAHPLHASANLHLLGCPCPPQHRNHVVLNDEYQHFIGHACTLVIHPIMKP